MYPTERPDVGYSLLAVDFMSHEAMHAALMRVSAGLAASLLCPLPTVTHNLGAVAAALRQMSQARHVGKVVVAPAAPLQSSALEGHFLVTGGVGEQWQSSMTGSGLPVSLCLLPSDLPSSELPRCAGHACLRVAAPAAAAQPLPGQPQRAAHTGEHQSTALSLLHCRRDPGKE